MLEAGETAGAERFGCHLEGLLLWLLDYQKCKVVRGCLCVGMVSGWRM